MLKKSFCPCQPRCGGLSSTHSGGGNTFCHTFTGGVRPHESRVLKAPRVYPIFCGSAYSHWVADGLWHHPGVWLMVQFLNDLLQGTWLQGLFQYGITEGHSGDAIFDYVDDPTSVSN